MLPAEAVVAIDEWLAVAGSSRVDVTGVGVDDDLARRRMGTLRDRATQVGGTFMISRTDGGGTHLVWTAPLP